MKRIVRLMLALCLASAAASAEDVPPKAIEAANQFIAALSEQDWPAIRAKMDFDACAQQIFRDEMPAPQSREHGEIVAQVTKAMRFIATESLNAGVFRQMRAQRVAQSWVAGEGAVGVDVVVKTVLREETVRVLLVRRDDGWSVFDFGLNGDTQCRRARAAFKEQGLNMSAQRFAAAMPEGIRQADAMSRRDIAVNVPATAPTTAISTPRLVRHATTQFTSPAEVMHGYVDMIQARRLPDAIEVFWDMQLVLREVHGEAMDSMPAAQQEEAAALMLVGMKRVMANRTLTEMMAQAKYSDFGVTEVSDRQAIVKLKMDLPQFKNTARFFLVKTDQGWKIYDNQLSGGDRMSVSMRRPWLAVKNQMTVLEFTRQSFSEVDDLVERGQRIDQALPPNPK